MKSWEFHWNRPFPAVRVRPGCVLKCSESDCNFRCTVHVLNNGCGFLIASNRQIFHHVNEKISRPIRGSQRRAIKEKFKAGGSVYRIHAQYDEQRTAGELHGFNYDVTGKSKKVFKKIKAEADAESLLSPNISLGILQLHDKLIDEINNEGTIKGALQIVQFRPFCVIAFTEASIRLYDAIVSYPDSVLSWDATGGVVKNSSSKQCLYYELTITHPNIVNEDNLVPLTFMLSESQTLYTIIQWLTAFKECHKKVCTLAFVINTSQETLIDYSLMPLSDSMETQPLFGKVFYFNFYSYQTADQI